MSLIFKRIPLVAISISIPILMAVIVGSGQSKAVDSKPDLTGTWIPKDNWKYQDHEMAISQSGEEILMNITFLYNKVRYRRTYKLFTDGRGESNLMYVPDGYSQISRMMNREMSDPLEFKSKTYWQKAKLIRKGEMTIQEPGYEGIRQKYGVSEEIKMSSDGLKLTVQSLVTGPVTDTAMNARRTDVYLRKK